MGAVKRVKNGEWEKNRRERLNLTFFELSRLLPDHDPTLALTKLEILNKSITYIKELQERNASLLGTNCSDALEVEMTSLREQVTELQRRNQQLAELLQTAKISLPPRPLPHSTPLTCPRKWAGKLPPDTDLKNVSKNKKGETKENPVKAVAQAKSSTKKTNVKIKRKSKTKVIINPEIETSKSETITLNNSINPLRELNNASSVHSVSPSSQTSGKNSTVLHSSVKSSAVTVACTSVQNPSVASVPAGSASIQSTVVLSRTVTVPRTTISLVLSNSKTSLVTVAKSNVLPAPIMATGIQPMLQCNPSLSSLGPGTLIMAGGRIVPVPPPPTVLTPTLILLPPTTSAVAVTTTRPHHKPTSNPRPIVPKPRQRDITKTTFANKVPIPAISTQRQGSLCSVPKPPPQNSLDPLLSIKKNLKKKSIVSKLTVKEKCPSVETNQTVSKPLSDISTGRILENQSDKDSDTNKAKNINYSKCSDKVGALKKNEPVGQCAAKRKSDVPNDITKGAKIAKVDGKSVENISCDSNKTNQEFSRFVNAPHPQESPTDVGVVEKLKSNKGPENISKQEELHINGHKGNNVHESNKVPSAAENVALREGVPSSTGTAVGSQNTIEKGNSISKRKDDTTTTVRNITCDKTVLCSSNKNSQNAAINNPNIEKAVDQNLCVKNNPRENPQTCREEDGNRNNSGDQLLKASSCLIADNPLSTDGYYYSKVVQQVSHAHVTDDSAKGEKQHGLLTTSPRDPNKNHEENNTINTSAQSCNDGMGMSTNNQHTPKSNLKDSTQKSVNIVNETRLNDKSQHVLNTTLSTSSSTDVVADSSTQMNFGVSKGEVFNKNSSHTNMLHFDNDNQLVFKTNVNVSATHKDQNNVLNVNNNNNNIKEGGNQILVGDGFNRAHSHSDMHFDNDSHQISNVDTSNNSVNKNKIPSGDKLNLAMKENVSQSNLNAIKSKNDKLLAVGVYSDETCKIININSGGDERAQDPSTQRNIFPSSEPQNLNLNIYTNEGKESMSNAHFNVNNSSGSEVKTVTSANNGQNPANSGNNCFNSQQTLHFPASSLDLVPSKNHPKLYNGRFPFNESVQQNISNKTGSLSTDQSFNFQNVNINNNIRGVSDTNVQSTNSGNLYTNGNCQHRSNGNINVLGNKVMQSTIPVCGNYNFIKALPSVDTNASSQMNVSHSSSNQIHFNNTQKQNPVANTGLISNDVTRSITDTTFNPNERREHISKTINSNNSAQSLNSGINLKGPNQNHVNISVDASKNTTCQNQQDVLKRSENSNNPRSETIKPAVTQNCKSTQVTSLQLTFAENEKHIGENKQQVKQNTLNNGSKKPTNELKSICDNKSLIQDDSQELTSLFPTDKLQSCSDNLFRDTCTEFRDRNLFMPVSHSYMDEMRLNLPHSDFSNDLLSSLQVPSTGQHPESISPTAAFLLAFPLVSTSKTSELITENEGGDSQHPTPTTILQIGNIEPSSSELFHQTALMMENSSNMMKQSKPTDTSKDNSSKQMKEIENFNKFQQMEINQLMRNENFTRNNFKEKKNFVGLGDQDIFYSECTKKKSNGKTNNYPMPSAVVPRQDKAFEFPENNIRSNAEQGRQISHNEKKNQAQPESGTSNQNIYNSSSQPYTYSSFNSGNEFMLPNSTYPSSNNQTGTESSKSLASSNFNVLSWTTASITSNSSHTDYTTPYCSYPQKPYSNPNQIKMQKNVQSNFEDQRLKEKPISNIHPLPKFANFQFNNSHPNQEIHGYPQSNQTDNTNYKPESKTKKLKTGSQRAPVNWMTAPDVRPLLPDASVAPVLPDVMFQHQKELDFSSAPNNMMMLNSSSNITSFNISTSTSNNPQTLYPNSHFSGVDLQLDFAPFPEISTSKPSRNPTNVPNSQQNPHNYSWSPSKSSIPLLPHIDSHMIPSTLPTLVGDLALGTTTPSGPVDTFRNLSMPTPTTPFNIETPVKKFEKKHENQKSATKPNDKDCFPNSERRSNRTVPEYCQKTHSHQSTNTSSSFLSVSQLVDQVKTEQSPTSRRTAKPSNKANNNPQKRNTSNQQTDKSKVLNNINNHSNYHHPNPGMVTQRKFDTHTGVYPETNNSGVGFPGTFANQGGPLPWQSEKPHRSTSHYKGSYSAESLIADQSTSVQGHVSELPQFPNQYSHPPVVSSASYPSTDFSHQNVQPLEFHQTHQNCFNFPSNSHYSSASFNPDGDYHLGLDHLFNFNPASNKHSSSCQTSTKDNRSSGKRGQSKQRREDFMPQWTPQVYPSTVRPKGPLPSHCPPSTSSPSHQGTTTLTNFNLSTIFPEINDKVGMPGPPPPSHFPPAPNFRPH